MARLSRIRRITRFGAPRADGGVVRGGLAIVPSRGAVAGFLFAAALELLSEVTSTPSLSLASAGIAGAVMAAGLSTPRLQGLRIRSEVPSRMTTGAPAVIRITCQQGFRWSRPKPLLVTVRHPAFGECVRVAMTAGSGDSRGDVTVTVTPGVRGYWDGATRLEVESVSPLGGWRRRCRVDLAGELWVHPAPAPPLRVGVEALDAGPQLSTRRRRMDASGEDVVGVREWRSGDGRSRVAWRATARAQRLMVVERDHPVSQDIRVIVSGIGAGPDWESSVASHAATAVSALRSGSKVEIVTGAGASSPRSATGVLDEFAALERNGVASASLPMMSPDVAVLRLDPRRSA